MDLFTRCPDCNTVFRVTTRHLQASGGQVRCGRCHSVFDAFASLTAKPPGERQEQAAPPPSEQPPAESPPAEPAAAKPTPAAATAAPAPQAVEPPAPSATKPAAKNKNAPRPDTAPAPEAEQQTAVDAATNLYEWEFKPAPQQRWSGLWLALSLLLLIGALVQAGTIFRTEVMVNFPQVKPLYQMVCERLSCDIGLPRLADQLNIEASDLQFVDPRRPNLVKLTALVRNRARVPVEYPAFELTLTNAQQQVVARRVFLPSDYLQNVEETETGLAGRRELAVSLFLDTGPLRAAGYRIYLFYP